MLVIYLNEYKLPNVGQFFALTPRKTNTLGSLVSVLFLLVHCFRHCEA